MDAAEREALADMLEPDLKPETILMKARRLGLATSRLPSLDEDGEVLRLAPVNVEDLLLRPGVKIDYRRVENFVRGKSIIVTGGGGSIGAEICDRIVTFGAARVQSSAAGRGWALDLDTRRGTASGRGTEPFGVCSGSCAFGRLFLSEAWDSSHP